jgi:prolyl oligopeptidase
MAYIFNMKKQLSICLVSAVLFACNDSNIKRVELPSVQYAYPETKLTAHTDTINGIAVSDNYRWLENDTSVETKAWVESQIGNTEKYFSNIKFRGDFLERLKDLANYTKYGQPSKVGDYYIFSKNDGLQNQYVYYVQKGLKGKEEVFLDPNTMSNDGTVSVSLAGTSKDKKYIAYTLQRAGSDWQEIYVMDIATKTVLKDKLEWVKFSGASWYKNGFFYNRFDKPKGSALAEANQYQKVYYHKLGDPQEKDQLIFEDKKVAQLFYGINASEDERYLFLSKSEGTGNYNQFFKDSKNPDHKDWVQITSGFTNETDFLDTDGDYILAITNLDAPNKRIVRIDSKNPTPDKWVTIVKERPEYIDKATTAGGSLFITSLKDVTSQVEQFDYNGKLVRKIELPGLGTAGGFGGYKEDTDVFYTFTSFTYPPTIFRYNIASGQSEVYKEAQINFDKSAYETKQEFFTSKDGTKVPVFVVHKKGLELNGKNPTLLYAYGGFSVNINPSFSASRLAFLEQGGVYVLANIRGGNEYGEEWHKGGMLTKKQNVFDDFIGAAEHLIQKKYTSSDYLAIQGGSNGGLLVGACMTQRPDLYRVAIPQVGVMDMMRYHRFTIGWGWTNEYGNPDSAAYTKYIHGYSPLHNIKQGQKYPATIITTGDHDDRVVPAHSFKFAAELQTKSDKSNPAIIRIEKQAGHGGGKPLSKSLEETADIYSFVFYNMGIEPQFKKQVKP